MWTNDFQEHTHAELNSNIREVLWGRGVSEEQIIEFKLGYFEGELPSFVPEGFARWSHQGEKIEGSFVFPLTDTLGRVQGFQFRSVDRAKKNYLDYYNHLSEPVLFGLSQAMPSVWRDEVIVLVEGVFDFFPVQRALPHTVSVLTSDVSDLFVRTLKRIFFFF